MIAITSPAKTQDFESKLRGSVSSRPEFETEADVVVAVLKKKSVKGLKTLLKVSDALTELNFDRFANWERAPEREAILAYKGDIYRQMTADSYIESEQRYAQEHVRMITGMYGVLRPYDVIKPYRLEMKIKLKIGKKSDLYEYWKEKVTVALNRDLSRQKEKVLIDLSSKEYGRVVDKKKLEYPIVEIVFKHRKKGKVQTIAILSKKARGMMLEFMIKNKLERVDELASFNTAGYSLLERTKTKMVFLQDL